jgi:hypothetical protein
MTKSGMSCRSRPVAPTASTWKVLNLPILTPAPMSMRWRRELGLLPLARLVNAAFDEYETLDLADLSWSYWHALCATPHIAAVHFGAAIEMLVRRYAATKPNHFPQKIIDDGSVWRDFRVRIDELISKLDISEVKRSALNKNVGGLNRVHQRDILDAVLRDIGIELGADEIQAWRRRHEAAHGIATEPGQELDAIRKIAEGDVPSHTATHAKWRRQLY